MGDPGRAESDSMLAYEYLRDHRIESTGDGGTIRAAYLSTYPPRECGIATFCEDLLTSTLLAERGGEPMVVAMETTAGTRDYCWPVVTAVDEMIDEQYEAVAEYINESSADVVSIQHEFGIFGGVEAEGLFGFLRAINKPVVTTLHTVLPKPDVQTRGNLRRVARCSDRLVVMNALAIDILERDYGIRRGKVSLIHHGVLPPSLETREQAKDKLGLSGRRVLSTFGLVARGKGLEYAISALPEVLKRHPDACYLIVGQTHPGVRRTERESYREELTARVEDLGLKDSVLLVNRYVSKAEIIRYLAATDIYITPYLNPGQISSGTLAYALAAGTAVVSTPYLYARFLLGGSRGLLVDFRSSDSIARAVNHLLDHPDLRTDLQRRGRIYGQQMAWPVVGARYLQVFDAVVQDCVASRPLSVQLELALQSHFGGKVRHATTGSRPAAAAGSHAAADGLLRHRTAR